jgi:hypothetical protein
MELFGFNITRNTPAEEPISFAPPENDEGAMMVSAGGVYGTYVDLDGSIRTEAELVNKYREMASHPDIELALEDIINEDMKSKQKIMAQAGDKYYLNEADILSYHFNEINMPVTNRDSTGKPLDHRTAAQKATMRDVLTEWKRLFPNAKILGHRDLGAKKACPCFNAIAEYADIK